MMALALGATVRVANANVYATNIKINGILSGSVLISSSTNASISYILNDAATAGVTIKILSGSSAVRTINVAPGNLGTFQGTNKVVWDGQGDNSNSLPGGNYSVSITVKSSGTADGLSSCLTTLLTLYFTRKASPSIGTSSVPIMAGCSWRTRSAAARRASTS
jgi:flagellar hook assembly protein FlgD